MAQDAALVASLVAPEELDAWPARYAERVAWLEVRADLVGDLDPEHLRSRFPGGLLYTLRSRAEGGAGAGDQGERGRRLIAAARAYDLVDLEVERDVAPAILEGVPAERRLWSWHGAAGSDLAGRLAKMTARGGRFFKLVPGAVASGDELEPLRLLLDLPPELASKTAAFATGPIGAWTRLVSPRLGAPLVYGSVAATPAAPGQPSIERLIDDFGLPAQPAIERSFGIVGWPVAHSLSPRLHNGAYRDLGIPALFLPFAAEKLGDFWWEVVEGEIFERAGAPLVGLAVTSPHKRAAIDCAGAISPRALSIESANTLVRRDGVWEAESTDPEGVLGPLRLRDVALEVPVLVFGGGGAGSAAALGLRDAGAAVTLSNRTAERGRAVADRLRVEFAAAEALDWSRFKVVVHATALGHRAEDPLPFDPEKLRADAVLVDLVYDLETTPLVAAARGLGLEVVDGVEVLLHQAVEQFRLMTGARLPLERGARRLRGQAVTEADGKIAEGAGS